MDEESFCNAGDAGDTGLTSGLGRFPGGGYGNPFQYSCLGNPRGKNGQRSLAGEVRGVAKGQTQLSD